MLTSVVTHCIQVLIRDRQVRFWCGECSGIIQMTNKWTKLARAGSPLPAERVDSQQARAHGVTRPTQIPNCLSSG